MTRSLSNSLLCMLILPASLFSAGLVERVNKDGNGVALKGYDAVAYFTGGGPVQGSPQFTHQWMSATWRFVSASNRDKFAAEPEKYAPQFGGYCAWAVSNNYTAPIDPLAWKIVGGKLYVNYSKSVQEKWSQDIPARIQAAEKNWPGLHK